MKLLVNFFIAFILILAYADFNFVQAGNHNSGNKRLAGKTRIRSDIIDIKQKTNIVNFIGNVVVEKEDSSLLADNMTVLYYENKNKEQDTQIKRIDAKNNVKIFSEEFIASATYGYYDPVKNIFVLQKKVIVNNGSSIAGGEEFIYDLKTRKGKFVGEKNETSITGNGGDKRVVVIIGSDIKDSKSSQKNKK